jgi:hypothetical protein
MRSFCSLCVYSKQAGIVEPEETAVARQRLSKHIPSATNAHARIEEHFHMLFSLLSVSYQILHT